MGDGQVRHKFYAPLGFLAIICLVSATSLGDGLQFVMSIAGGAIVGHLAYSAARYRTLYDQYDNFFRQHFNARIK